MLGDSFAYLFARLNVGKTHILVFYNFSVPVCKILHIEFIELNINTILIILHGKMPVMVAVSA